MAVATRRKRRSTVGRTQRQRAASGRTRLPNLDRYYGRRLPAITPGEFRFELTLMRGRGVEDFPLDAYLVSFEWTDEETAMSGNVQLRRRGAQDRASLPIGRGHRIRCRVLWAGHWYELWTMRCDSPEVTIDSTGVAVSVDVNDDLDTVRRARRRFLRRTRKRHRHGYFGHRVLREEAAKEGVRLGAIAKCRYPMTKIDVNGSLLDLATAIYTHERQKSGRRFVLRMRDGRFEVVPYRRNRLIYVLAEQIRTVTASEHPKVANPVTVLVGKGRVGKGKGAKKVRYAEYRRDMVRRFGYVRKERNYGRVDSFGELRAKVRRDLADQYRVDQTCDIEHQGIPFIRRGDGAQLDLPSEGYIGDRSFVYCSGGRHQVQADSFTSSWTFTTVDPFQKDRDRREKEARARKRRARQKRKRGTH